MNKAQFMKAARSGDVNLIEKYIKDGFDISTDNNLALKEAIEYSSLAVIKTLIENGADVNAKDKNRNTALIWASKRGEINIVETLLIDYKAKVSDEDILKLKIHNCTFTLDLIKKMDLEKQLQQEIKQIPETPIKKKSLSMKI